MRYAVCEMAVRVVFDKRHRQACVVAVMAIKSDAVDALNMIKQVQVIRSILSPS